MDMAARILVVEDEKEIADLIELYLKNENFEVAKFYNPLEVLSYMEGHKQDLAVLDVMMPHMDGFELLRRLREQYTFPVIMLTAKVGDMDKIQGLTIGADDYMTKPFNPLELVARVKAQLRRSSRYNGPGSGENLRENDSVIDFNGLVINRDTHQCTLFGKILALTPIEFSILWLLCENRGRVISSEELFEKVWGEKYLDSNNTVMVHIRRIREKMGEPARNPRFIKTVWGVGYKIENGLSCPV